RAVGPAERDMVQPTHRGVGRVALRGDRGGVTAPYDLGAVIEARAARCADLNLGGAGDMVVGHAPGGLLGIALGQWLEWLGPAELRRGERWLLRRQHRQRQPRGAAASERDTGAVCGGCWPRVREVGGGEPDADAVAGL